MARTKKNKRSPGRILGDILVTLIVLALLGTAAWLLYKEFFPNNTPIIKMQVTKEDKTIDWDALRAINGDTVGWLSIEGTNIDTPVVYTSDNNKYLYTAFDGSSDERGTPFLDMDYSWGDPKSQNSVIYGHSTMRSGVPVMFDDLLNYVKDPTFINKNGAIVYNRPPELGGDGTWAIFAVLEVEAEVDYRQPTFGSQEEFMAYYQKLKAASIVSTAVEVGPEDEVLTLSTCIFNTGLNDGRLAILAKRVK